MTGASPTDRNPGGGRGPVDTRLLRHARTSRAGVAVLTLLGAGQAAATLAIAAALTLLVVSFTHHGAHPGAVALLAGGYAARAALSWAEQVVAQRTAARVGDELRRAVSAAALRHGPAWVAGYGTGRLSALLGGGLDALRPWFGGYLPALVLSVTLPPCVVAVMAVADPASAVITVLTLPLVPVFGALIGWATRAQARRRWAADARLAGHFLDAVRGLATLRLFGRAQRQVTVVRQMTERHRAATMRVLRIAFLSSTALDLLGSLAVGLVAVQAGLRVAAGDLALAPALLVILLAPEAFRPLREAAARYHTAADATAVIVDVDEVLTASPAAARTDDADADADAPPGVTATGLRVRHRDAGVDALLLPALTVAAGEIVALSGPSGAGKTTALRALTGVQGLASGRVRVAGPRPLYLPQRPTLPHARTIREALAPDNPDARPVDGAAVRWALRAVGLDAEVAALPAGLDTPLGEHGRGVSSGQRQRIALARLLAEARRAPAVLLLDEPTAHLDPATESRVIAQLRDAAARGCAVLVVAHRPALLAAADRVVTVRPPAVCPAPAAQPGAPGRSAVSATGARSARPARSATPAASRAPAALLAPVPPADRADGRPRPRRGALQRDGVRGGGTAALLGAASTVAGLVLTGAAGWLLVRASTLPPVLTLSIAAVLVRAAAVTRPLLRYLERLVAHEVAFARLGDQRAQVYADLVPRVPGVLSQRRGELLTRIVDDVDARVDGLLRGRLPVLAAGIAVAVATAVAAMLLPAAGAMLLAGLAVAGGLAPALAGRHADRVDAATGAARAALRDAVVETVDGLEELASRDPAAALRMPDRCSRALSAVQRASARTAGAATALAHVGCGAAASGVAAVLGAAMPHGLGAQTAVVLLFGAVVLGETVPGLTDAALARRRAAGAEARLTALAAQPVTARLVTGRPTALAPVATPPGATLPVAVRAGTGRPAATRCAAGSHAGGRRLDGLVGADRGTAEKAAGLRVRGLVAGWDPRRPPALRGLNLDVPPGGRVAIRGPSGGGKSTLAAVLTGLLDARAGTVTLTGAGCDGGAGGGKGVRARVCLVGDEADHVFASTVRENLRLARPTADDAELCDVLGRVRLGGWLATLPDGLDTWLGEGGGTVSGGERRRLAAARALLAAPDVLVLDEPTEGLDAPTASALMTDLMAATAGHTVLLLTHLAEGLAHVDAVHRLVDGMLSPAEDPESAPGDADGPVTAMEAPPGVRLS